MIINQGRIDETELEDGYYWATIKGKDYSEIVKLDGDHFKTFCGNEFSQEYFDDLSNINLQYDNELTIDFVEFNAIKYSLKYGSTANQLRYLSPGDQLILGLRGHLPPVSAKSTDELERLNELALKQNDLIEEQKGIISRLKLKSKNLPIYYYNTIIIMLLSMVILTLVLK